MGVAIASVVKFCGIFGVDMCLGFVAHTNVVRVCVCVRVWAPVHEAGNSTAKQSIMLFVHAAPAKSRRAKKWRGSLMSAVC